MQYVADFAQRARFDRIDQRAHAVMQRLGLRHAVGIALAPLGGMFSRAAFGVVDRLTRKQRIAARGEALILRQVEIVRHQLVGQMGLGPVEPDRPLRQDKLGQAVGIGRENGLEIGDRQCGDGRQCSAGHAMVPYDVGRDRRCTGRFFLSLPNFCALCMVKDMLDVPDARLHKPPRPRCRRIQGTRRPPMTAKSETRDFLWFLARLGLFVFILRSFIISPFNIPSESMQPRLLIGDYLLVAKWPYGYSRYSLPFSVPLIPGRIFASTPERGDVVVFKAPPTQKNDYIKRVIGLPGDMIAVRGGTVYLNGAAVPKQKVADLVIPVTPNMIEAAAKEGAVSPCYRPDFEEPAAGGGKQCRYPQFRETLPAGKDYPARSYNVLDLVPDGAADDRDTVLVPEGHLFMMGDNRDRSADSRFPAVEGGGIGLVPEENLVGKAMISVFSTDGSANWLLPWTWISAARWSRIGEGF